MKTYAKLAGEHSILRMGRVPNICNPTDAQIAAYAAANGYKELVATTMPGTYYHRAYEDAGDCIREAWEPWPLSEAKADALEQVQADINMRLDTRVTLKCEGYQNGIVYDRNACLNALGLDPGDSYIDAADNVSRLTAEDIARVKAALTAHRKWIYSRATARRVKIDEAGDVDAVESALEAALDDAETDPNQL